MFLLLRQAQEKTWCVAQRSAPTPKLQGVLDYFCGKYDCKEILPRGQCFAPDTVYDHASYDIDLNFQINNECDISYATTTTTNPCKFLSCLTRVGS